MNEVNYSDYFYYDESSRTFLRWKRDCRKYKQSSVAGSFCYDSETENPVNIRVRLNERLELVHRIIWELHNGTIPEGMVIDHLDGDPFNNKISNLECKTSQHDSQNRRVSKNNKSGVAGVYRTGEGGRNDRYVSHWREDGQLKHKSFSVKKFGIDGAFILAIEYRAEQIKRLNEEGAKYTERHISGGI